MQNTKPKPRPAVEDSFAADRPCPICASMSLSVTHLEELPDYVQCAACGSAFVLDAYSDMALYGSISPDYPDTQQFALKRWVALESVAARASTERRQSAPIEARPQTPPFGGAPAEAGRSETQAPPPDVSVHERADMPTAEPEASTEDLPHQAPVAVAGAERGPIEPEPGQRFRVIVAGLQPKMPNDHCAHCFRSPAPRSISITGDYPDAQPVQIPLCQVCHRRATARTEEERTSKLVAQLSAALIAAVLIVFAMAIGLIDLRGNLLGALLLALILGGLGYALPVRALLRRVQGYRSPQDSIYVNSTLILQPRRDGEELEFLWRNASYADHFQASNLDIAEEQITKVFESGRLSEPEAS